MSVAHEILNRARFGGAVVSKQSLIKLTALNELVLKRQPERVSLSITNLTLSDIEIAFQSDISNAYRVVIQASGGTLLLNANDDGEFATTGIHAISFGGTIELRVLEIIRYDNESEVK